MTSVSASGGRSPVRLCRIVPQTNDPPAWLKAGRAFSFLATSVSAAITKAASDPRAPKSPCLECPCCRQACWGFSFLSALVNLASMRNIDHENDEPAVIDVAQDSVVTDPVSPHA